MALAHPELPDAQEHSAIETGLEAQRELEELLPELYASIRAAYQSICSHMRENGGKLDSEYAVQQWYRVEAEFAVERRLNSLIKKGSASARAIQKRQQTLP